MVVADSARAVLQKIDAIALSASSLSDTHTPSPAVRPSDALSASLYEHLRAVLPEGHVRRGGNVTTDDYRLAPPPGDFRAVASGAPSSSSASAAQAVYPHPPSYAEGGGDSGGDGGGSSSSSSSCGGGGGREEEGIDWDESVARLLESLLKVYPVSDVSWMHPIRRPGMLACDTVVVII